MPKVEIVDKKQVCWINSDEAPVSIERLKIFDYQDDLFFELCRYKYLRDDIVYDTLLRWEKVELPHNKRVLFKFVIDAMKELGN